MAINIDKPWGQENIFTPTDAPYTGKIIYLKAGLKWSLQVHDSKQETFTLYSGNANLTTGPDKDQLHTETMLPHEGYTIKPNTVHQVEAITDCVIIEVSTPETGTTKRLQDDYSRPDETPEIRNLPNRGWTPQS
jgi:mannose-6-phosphate isomerase-like protein (cupin superfamily)